jgi:hypothetical protein
VWGGYQLQQVRTIAFCSKDPNQNLTQMLELLNYKGRELNPSSKLGKGRTRIGMLVPIMEKVVN